MVVAFKMSRIDVDGGSDSVSWQAGLMSVDVRMTMGRANRGGDIEGREVGRRGR